MRKNKTAWHRTLLAFLLIGTILIQTIAGIGIGETIQAAAQETGGVTDEPEESATLENYIVDALKAGETTIDVSSYRIPFSERGKYVEILKNHPELFYVRQSNQVMTDADDGSGIVTAYQVQYIDDVTKEQIEDMSAAMEKAADAAAACVESDMEPYEKALAVHDYLIQNCKYDYANMQANTVPEISHTAYGALVDGQAVCDGYAGAYLYIMRDKLGIPCRIVTSEQMVHSWNMIQLDGKWYHVDLTWDDPVWDCIGRVSHDNFLLSDSKISNGSPDAPSGENHYAWDGDIAADSDTYDDAFWSDIRSAIVSYNGSWYYSKFQPDGNNADTAVKLVKRDSLLDGAETVMDTAPAWTEGEGVIQGSYMFPVKSGDCLYYNTPTEIRRIGEEGYPDGVYSLKDTLGEKQMFGFSMKDGNFYFAPAESYAPDVEQTDIQTVAAEDVVFQAPDQSGMVGNPTAGSWSYIYFGSYPQTEVTGDDLTDAIKNASYDANGDATVDGVKYRRIYTKHGLYYDNTSLTDCFVYYKWEPIRWRVLQKTEDKLLVMADMGLDYIDYNQTGTGFAWTNSRIKDWLNNEEMNTVYEPNYQAPNNFFSYYFYLCEDYDNGGVRYMSQYIKDEKQEKVHSFYMTAFDAAQREAITAQGGDKLFLLSAEDVRNESYGFQTADKLPARVLSVSEYARKKSSYAASDTWWLRADDDASAATVVGSNGDIIENYETYGNLLVSCAPAMYISLSSDQWVSEETILRQEKASAKEKLENYRSAAHYRKAERKTWTAAVADGKAAIERAGSPSAVKSALEAAIAAIAKIKTDSDYRAEARGDLETMELDPVHHCNANGDEDTTDWKYIYFGSSPQTEVKDKALIEELNDIDGSWTGSGDMTAVSRKEVTLNGEKYTYIYQMGWYKWEPIKWRVLQNDEDSLFVVADSTVSVEKYMEGSGSLWWSNARWNNSYMKSFLNEDFLKNAFNEREREAIIPENIEGEESSVYLLTKEEATKEAYGFCKDAAKASASRHIEKNDYCDAIRSYWGAMSPTLASGYAEPLKDFWWLRGVSDTDNTVATVNAGFNDESQDGTVTDNLPYQAYTISNQEINYLVKAYVVPALRVLKSSGYWSFEPESGSKDPFIVEQAIEDAKRELETGYLKDDYSEEAWVKVLAAIEEAKQELEDAENTGDVTSVLDAAKEDIAKIPTKEQEKVLKRLEGLSNPKHTHVLTDGAVAEGDEDKDVTEWSYVYLGSYPQSKVTDKNITAAVDAAIEAGDAAAVDTGIESSYMEIYDAEIDGSKYRRLKITKIGEGDDVITTYYKWEPVKWKVLQIENETNSLYLMADQKIEYRQMDREVNAVTWRNSDLRTWLNQDFFEAAFNADEQDAVLTWQVQFPDADHGNAVNVAADTTEDRVYLLSYNELYQEKYGFCPLHDNRGNGNRQPVSSRQQTQTDYQIGLVQALPGMYKGDLEDILAGDVEKVLKYYQESLGFESFDAARKDSGSGQFTWTRSPGFTDENQADFSRTFYYGFVCPVGANTFFKQGVVPVLHVNAASELWKTELDLKKDAAKAELAAYKANDDAYYAKQQEERRAIREEGNANIENAGDEEEIQNALQAAKERLDGVLTIGEIKMKEWEETHPEAENLKNPVAAENPEENSASYSYVYFGSYPQSLVSDADETAAVQAAMADKEDGEDAWVEIDGVRKKYRKYRSSYFRWEPIKWRVLQKEMTGDGETASLLLMADNGLDAKKFNESGYAEWKDSTLREWLTGDFCNEAFNLTQQEILISPVLTDDEGYVADDLISLPSYGALLKEEYGFHRSAAAQKSRVVSPSDYASALSYNARFWWQSSTVQSSSMARLTMQDGSVNSMNPCDGISVSCVPVVRVNMFTEGAYSLNPEEIKAGQNVVEEIPERLKQYEELISDYDEADRETLQAALAQAEEAIANAGGDIEAIKNAMSVLEAVFAEKTEEMRRQIQSELDNLGQEINYEDYYEAQQNEIAEALEGAGKTIERASDVKTMRDALDEAKKSIEGIKTKAEVDAEAETGRTEATNKLNAYLTESELAKYDEEDQDEIRSIVAEALANIEDAVDNETVQEALRQAEDRIAGILTKEQKVLSAVKDQAKRELETFLTDEKKALYREAEWNALTEVIRDAMKEVDDAADSDAVQTVLNKAKTDVAAIKTDAQLKEEEAQNPSDPGTTDPGTTDPGTTDPGTTDPGTTDPGTTKPGTTNPGTTNPGTTNPGTTPVLKKGDSVIKGSLKFVVLDPVKKTASVEGVASAKKKKFAVSIPSTVVVNGSECKVTEVKAKGFAKFVKITKVSLGKNITKVGKNAFNGCKAIKSLTVNGNIKTFDSKSFYGCKKLKTITFKSTKVPTFKSGAFKGTASKVKVKLAAKMSKKNKTKMKSKLKKAGIK